MKVKTNQGVINAKLIKQNKRTVIVEVKKGDEVKQIKRKLRDIVAESK